MLYFHDASLKTVGSDPPKLYNTPIILHLNRFDDQTLSTYMPTTACAK